MKFLVNHPTAGKCDATVTRDNGALYISTPDLVDPDIDHEICIEPSEPESIAMIEIMTEGEMATTALGEIEEYYKRCGKIEESVAR